MDGKEHARLTSELADARHDQRLYRELFEDALGLICVHDLEGVLLDRQPGGRPFARFQTRRRRWGQYEAFSGPAGAPPF